MAGFVLDVKFNDTSMRETFGIELLNYTIQSAPTRKSRGINIPGRDGTYKTASPFSSKQIELSVVVKDATPEGVHKKIRTFLTWLSQQDEPKVIFTDNPSVFVRADLDKSDDYYVTRGVENAVTQFDITLYQYDPFSYDNGVISYSFELEEKREYEILNEGIYTPYVIKLFFSKDTKIQGMATSLGHGGIVEQDNSEITMALRLKINGVTQALSGIFSIDDVIEINGRELTVKKNEESAIAKWEGDIQDLTHGKNILEVLSLGEVKLFITIEFYRRWL